MIGTVELSILHVKETRANLSPKAHTFKKNIFSLVISPVIPRLVVSDLLSLILRTSLRDCRFAILQNGPGDPPDIQHPTVISNSIPLRSLA